jgi:hypothetical protein
VGAFFGLWAAGIVLSIVILATNPKRTDVSQKIQSLRTGSIAFGFLPCVGLGLLIQVVYLALYRAALSRTLANQERLRSGLATDFGQNSGLLPPASPQLPSPPNADNPFL